MIHTLPFRQTKVEGTSVRRGVEVTPACSPGPGHSLSLHTGDVTALELRSPGLSAVWCRWRVRVRETRVGRLLEGLFVSSSVPQVRVALCSLPILVFLSESSDSAPDTHCACLSGLVCAILCAFRHPSMRQATEAWRLWLPMASVEP